MILRHVPRSIDLALVTYLHSNLYPTDGAGSARPRARPRSGGGGRGESPQFVAFLVVVGRYGRCASSGRGGRIFVVVVIVIVIVVVFATIGPDPCASGTLLLVVPVGIVPFPPRLSMTASLLGRLQLTTIR